MDCAADLVRGVVCRRFFSRNDPCCIQEPFRAYLEWVLRGLSEIGSSDVIVVNAHLEPAHFSAILEACLEVSAETGRMIHGVDYRPDLRWQIDPNRLERRKKLRSHRIRTGRKHDRRLVGSSMPAAAGKLRPQSRRPPF